MSAFRQKYSYIDENTVRFQGRDYKLYAGPLLQGERSCIEKHSARYPESLRTIPRPPEQLYVIGDPTSLQEGLAVIGARKATPYGIACVDLFAGFAAEKGIVIISGGAYGCDAAAHKAALSCGGKTVVFLGGGCDQVYPSIHYRLFQDVIDAGGAVVSEQPWAYPALPYTFRERNRLIAGLSKAVLIVEAGLPSGTFSTADEALSASREVLVVPGAISSPSSAGSNRLLFQGATPICDLDTFSDVLFSLFGVLKEQPLGEKTQTRAQRDPLLEALRAEPMRLDQIIEKVSVPKRLSSQPESWLKTQLVKLEAEGVIARFPDGRYGPARISPRGIMNA